MKNTLFDEKIDGTAHLALGNSLPEVGGSNQSQIHWDIVKDLSNGGRIGLDGEIVQKNGRWLIAASSRVPASTRTAAAGLRRLTSTCQPGFPETRNGRA